jgi:hypothetical protein
MQGDGWSGRRYDVETSEETNNSPSERSTPLPLEVYDCTAMNRDAAFQILQANNNVKFYLFRSVTISSSCAFVLGL